MIDVPREPERVDEVTASPPAADVADQEPDQLPDLSSDANSLGLEEIDGADLPDLTGSLDDSNAVDDAENVRDLLDEEASDDRGEPAPMVLSSRDFDARAQAWADAFESAADVKEVEFVAPEPATVDAADLPIPDADLAAAREREVVDAARVELTGRQAAGDVIGVDPVRRVDEWHSQGRNEQKYEGTCGLASTAGVLRDSGVEVSEDDMVRQAVDAGVCVVAEDPAESGGTNAADRAWLLRANGVESTVETPNTPEELATAVDSGRGVITQVNAGELWNESERSPEEEIELGSRDMESGLPRPDHAVVVTGTCRDTEGRLTGFVVNDYGDPEGAGRVVDLGTWDSAWTNVDGGHATNITANDAATEREWHR